MVASRQEIDRVIDIVYSAVMPGEMELAQLEVSEEDDDETTTSHSDNVVVKVVNKIILNAYYDGASDVHIEPNGQRNRTVVRIRKDGELQPYLEVPPKLRRAVVSRIKVMAGLDVTERRKPQDGKIDLRRYSKADVELRVATIPTAGGQEDVIIRILASALPVPVGKLGLSASNQEALLAALGKPHGLFLVCGPTGSGKTTTLHSCLGHLNRAERKIWTAEDPVEISQPGLRQVQVNSDIGLTFAAAMRAFLRADPDIIMVGEMRDEETTRIGIEASLTGHLVLSTIHTNSAPEAVSRLLDMGMDPFNFSDALNGIIAQRLTKRLCPACKSPVNLTPADVDELLDKYFMELRTVPGKEDRRESMGQEGRRWVQQFADPDGGLVMYAAKGCPECNDTGYRGRLALHELLIASEDARRLIRHRKPVAELRELALADGMRTLKQDGIEKVLLGQTDLHQVRSIAAG